MVSRPVTRPALESRILRSSYVGFNLFASHYPQHLKTALYLFHVLVKITLAPRHSGMVVSYYNGSSRPAMNTFKTQMCQSAPKVHCT